MYMRVIDFSVWNLFNLVASRCEAKIYNSEFFKDLSIKFIIK